MVISVRGIIYGAHELSVNLALFSLIFVNTQRLLTIKVQQALSTFNGSSNPIIYCQIFKYCAPIQLISLQIEVCLQHVQK